MEGKLKEIQSVQVDKIDEKLLNLLMDNSRTKLRELAALVRTSPATVLNRIRKLEKASIIRKYSAIVDFTKLGFDTSTVINIKISSGRFAEFKETVSSSPYVSAVYNTTGQYDAVVLAKFKSTAALDSFLKKLQSLDFIQTTTTAVVLNIMKEDQIKL